LERLRRAERGFAVEGLDVFGGPDESVRLREVARVPAFREAVTWQSREALASAVDKLGANERASPARRLRQEEIVASYWQRYCAKNDTIGFFGPLAWGSFDESGPAAVVRAGDLVRERVVHLKVWVQGIFARRHPDPVAFSDWVSADVRGQVVNLPPRGGVVPMTARMFPFVRGKDYIHIVPGPSDAAPEGVRAVSIGDLSVDEGHVSDRAGSFRLPLADLLWLPVFISSVRSFDPFGRRGSGRVTIGRTVVRRARWARAAGELPREPDAIASWAREEGMPRRVFVRSPLERKPIYVDLASPTLLRVLTRFLRPAAEKAPHAPVILTEMLPGPDECWLADDAGRYTSEFRTVAVDRSRRAA
jgi:hypothetical protein